MKKRGRKETSGPFSMHAAFNNSLFTVNDTLRDVLSDLVHLEEGRGMPNAKALIKRNKR
jgi:hypothetical protein